MNSKPAVWIDLENAPHAWVLSPIVRHLRSQGFPLILTARDFSCTVELSRRLGYDAQVVGRSGVGRSSASKRWRVLERAFLLFARMLRPRNRIGLAISHGSRSQILAAHYLGIPVLSLDDYEFSNQSLIRFVDHLLVPFPIARDVWDCPSERVIHYPGLKEELYLCSFDAASEGFRELNGHDRVRVLFRPEGRFAHYRSAQSEELQNAILAHLAGLRNLFLVLLPRDPLQGDELVKLCRDRGIPHWLPTVVLDGPRLIWEMDVVVGGGGTMTREAAVLGVPTYSFFAGRWGAVDRYLQGRGRIARLSSGEDVSRMLPEKRDRGVPSVSGGALKFVTGFIESAIVQWSGNKCTGNRQSTRPSS